VCAEIAVSGNTDRVISSFIWRSEQVTILMAYRGRGAVGRKNVTRLYRGSFVTSEKEFIDDNFNMLMPSGFFTYHQV
jgi:hypothetical protein